MISAALRLIPLGIVRVIEATDAAMLALPVIPVLPDIVTDVPLVGTVNVTDVAEPFPIIAGVELPAAPLYSFTVISFPPQPASLVVAVNAEVTLIPLNTREDTVNVLPVVYQPSFIVEVIVVSHVIAT